jgi:glycosyltransferase involved in cell wall biosynthesis
MAVEISVIMPFLNEEEYIRRCLESLFAADYPSDRVEFIFVDNGSTDRGPAIVREYPRVRLLTETDGKSYTARNAGLEAAAGDVIAFTDADCAVARGWLAAIREETFERGAAFVMGAVGFARPRSALLDMIEAYRNDHIEFVIENRIWNHVYGYTNNMAVRAEVFRRFGRFAELPVPGDTEIVHRCLRQEPETRVAFRRDMWIEHLELVSARTLYRKLFDYGEFEMHLPQPRYDPTYSRPKSGAEAHIIQKNRFSIPKRLLFDFAVHSIATCFVLGKWRARMRRALRGVATRRR